MKFSIRDGFVLAYKEVSELTDGTKQEREVKKYPSDGSIDLDEARAAQHAHILEPEDAAAKKFLTSLHTTPNVTDVGPSGVDVNSPEFNAAVATAVRAQLAALGLSAPGDKVPA